MSIAGKAGYLSGGQEQFSAAIVGAWRGAWRGEFCTETLAGADGVFMLDVPSRCFTDGEVVYLTSGGFTTCVALPFAPGGRVDVVLLGERDARCARVVNTGSCLNVRASPEEGAPVLACIQDGAWLRHTGETRPGGDITWLEVITPSGARGWASTAYLEW